MSSRPPATLTASNHHHHRHHNPYHYSPHYSSSPSLKGCCCCLILLLSFLLLLLLAIILVILLAIKPKKPQFDLQQVTVQYIGITPSTSTSSSVPSSSSSLSLTIRLMFMAENPNKVGIKYGESRFTVMYRGVPLGEGTVAGFYQAERSLREVETTVAVDRVDLEQAMGTELVRDAEVEDRVELRVLGDVGAKIRILSFDTPAVQVSIDCAIVVSPTKQSLTYKQCGFNGVNV